MSDIHHLLEGKVVLYRRAGSSRWQARFRRNSESGWDRFATGKDDLEKAKEAALRTFFEIGVKAEHGIAIGSRHSFTKVAEEVIAELEVKQRRPIRGSVVAKSYIFAIRGYLIPFFDKKRIDAIGPSDLEEFSAWRREKLGYEPKKSTVNVHNVALRLIFKHAYKRKWRGDVPDLENDGVSGDRGSWFEPQEVLKLRAFLERNVGTGRKGVSKAINQLLWSYVELVLATGMRPGTETRNLRWRDLEWFEHSDGLPYARLRVKGKTGERTLIVGNWAAKHFDRLCLPWDRNPDAPIFALPNGEQPKDMHGAFERCLRHDDVKLLRDSSGRTRTLYSLRHTYATAAILVGTDLHTLARQMGTSVAMLERHYSHLTPSMRAPQLALTVNASGGVGAVLNGAAVSGTRATASDEVGGSGI